VGTVEFATNPDVHTALIAKQTELISVYGQVKPPYFYQKGKNLLPLPQPRIDPNDFHRPSFINYSLLDLLVKNGGITTRNECYLAMWDADTVEHQQANSGGLTSYIHNLRVSLAPNYYIAKDDKRRSGNIFLIENRLVGNGILIPFPWTEDAIGEHSKRMGANLLPILSYNILPKGDGKLGVRTLGRDALRLFATLLKSKYYQMEYSDIVNSLGYYDSIHAIINKFNNYAQNSNCSARILRSDSILKIHKI
jgi:hypothetical protein